MSSRIPVAFPGAATTAAMKKAESKDTAAAVKADVLKAQRDNLPRKNAAAKVHKGASSTRYGQQADLRDQNQALLVSNLDLQQHLTDTQLRVAELEQKMDGLEKENTDVQRRLRDCHVLLVAEKIDPVSGERVGASVQGKEEERREIMSVSRDLLHELNAFGDMASKQHTQLEEIQAAMLTLSEARERLAHQRADFSRHAADVEEACNAAEQLLAA